MNKKSDSRGEAGLSASFRGYRRFLVLLITMIGLFCLVAALVLSPKLFPARRDVTKSFVLYLEELEPAGKLVVLTSRQRFVASREFTATLLAIVKLKASIDLSVMADVSYYIELSRPELWSAAWDRATKTLTLRLPAPAALPPAIRTETIEIHEHGSNLLTASIFRLKEEAGKMLGSLSSDIAQKTAETLSDSRLEEKIRSSIENLAGTFCLSAIRMKPEHFVLEYR